MNKQAEEVKGAPGTVFVKYQKSNSKTPMDADFNPEEWRPRNNNIIVRGILKKRSSGLVIPDSVKAVGDTADFFIFKVGDFAKDLVDSVGKAVILRDYTLNLSLIPIFIGEDVAYYITFEHNIIMVEE